MINNPLYCQADALQLVPAQVDLHCHSTCSDGRQSPARMAELMAEHGVQLWSLTDHDCLTGQQQAMAASRALGLHYLPGVECSAKYGKGQVHVVGLGVGLVETGMPEAMQFLQEARRERALEIDRRLTKAGLPSLLAAAQLQAAEAELGRPHFARAMVAERVVKDERQAFDLWLGAGKLGDVKLMWPELDQVIAWIRESGGRAVLAHPHRLKLTLTKVRALVADFARQGGQALELSVPAMDPQWQVNLARDAESLGLSYSRGSDFHGPTPWVKPGQALDWPTRLPGVWQDMLVCKP